MVFPDLKHIFQNKYSFLATAVLLVIPAYSWKKFFNDRKKLKDDYEQEMLFHKRHNCVVTYQPNKGISGWPPNVGRIQGNSDKLFEDLYEPILYFIRTAKQSLDIAVMLITVKILYLELVKARKRGVRIRLLCNFQNNDSSQDQIRKLMAEGIFCNKFILVIFYCYILFFVGIELQFFVAPSSTLDSLMHNKYIIKDYTDDRGFVCMGSMNFTASSPLNNYESFVFMSNHNVVEAFERNFEECWQNISLDNEGLINKTILSQARLDS